MNCGVITPETFSAFVRHASVKRIGIICFVILTAAVLPRVQKKKERKRSLLVENCEMSKLTLWVRVA